RSMGLHAVEHEEVGATSRPHIGSEWSGPVAGCVAWSDDGGAPVRGVRSMYLFSLRNDTKRARLRPGWLQHGAIWEARRVHTAQARWRGHAQGRKAGRAVRRRARQNPQRVFASWMACQMRC